MFVAYLRGIETREILPSGCISLYPFVAYLRGIETIDFLTFLLELTLFVCSLPTRDWNPSAKLTITKSNGFVAYLRGIETLFGIEPLFSSFYRL